MSIKKCMRCWISRYTQQLVYVESEFRTQLFLESTIFSESLDTLQAREYVARCLPLQYISLIPSLERYIKTHCSEPDPCQRTIQFLKNPQTNQVILGLTTVNPTQSSSSKKRRKSENSSSSSLKKENKKIKLI